jgi:hypothetical protein
MPGWTDGYGDDLNFVYAFPYYQNIVAGTEGARRRKRGGPYPFTQAQIQFIMQLFAKLKLSDDDIANGTGYKLLFDLQGKQSTNDVTSPSSLCLFQRTLTRQLTWLTRKNIKTFLKS